MTAPRRRYELLRAQLNEFARWLHKVDRGDVRAIHKARVASRRLRELLPVLQLEAGSCERILRELRRGTRELGKVRELDVTGATVQELRAQSAAGDPALGQMLDQVQRARIEAHDRLVRKALVADLQRVARRIEKEAAALEQGAAHDETRRWRWALDARVVRRARGLQKAIGYAGSVYLPDRLHAVRKSLKKLRYAVELAGQASGARASADIRGLSRGQELLGRLHDRQVVIDRIRQVQATFVPSDRHLVQQLDAVLAGLEDDCRRLHGRYVRSRKALLSVCDRLGSRTSLPVARAGRGSSRLASAG